MFIFSASDFRFCFSCVLIVLVLIASSVTIGVSNAQKNTDYVCAEADEEIAVSRQFLYNKGWTVASEAPDVEEIAIPAQFNKVFEIYNELQKMQGFDLMPFRGRVVTKIVFMVEGYPGVDPDGSVRATVLLSGTTVIGGDISSVQADGFMHGFLFEKTDYEYYPT